MIMSSIHIVSRDLTALKTIKVYTKEDFDEMFVIPKRVLSLVGIRMTHNISDLQDKCWSLLYWLEMTNILVFLPTEFLSMVVTAINATSFREGAKMFRMIPCFGTVVLSVFKSMKIKTNRTTFENIHHELREMWKTGRVTEDEHRIISPVSKQLNYIIKGVMVIWSNIAWDMLFCVYIAHVTIQFKLLSQRVRGLIYVRVDQQLVASYPLAKVRQETTEDDNDVPNGTLQNEWEMAQQRELVNIVKTHHKLIRLTADMEAMFSLVLLVNFINSTTIICFCGFCCVVSIQTI
ncbi:unnamed protein product [Arctia plantaginis]|uniref:Uncharacterized protein n=1 Tax=Arctia plantaginis TaxID=874455 RepID=A0A8S0YLR1_ARCPL|nr:unnamed protein product [Arctia plantaginis]